MPWRPLLDPDEGRYAEIPREMLARGDWITPRLNDVRYFEKPPLQYWATAALYSVFGVKEWTARLWTVGLSFLCLPMVFCWTRRLFGQEAALAALTSLAVSPYFAIIGQLNLLDGAFSLWLCGAVLAFALAQCAPIGSASERRWMLAAWLAGALAVLSKGIVVGVLVGSTLILYSLLERDRLIWRRLHWMLGLPLFLLVTLPWFVAVSWRNPAFAEFFFVHEHFARFLTTVHQRVEPWWYFAAILAFAALPWLIPVAGACRAAWLDNTQEIPFKPLKMLLIFSAFTLLFFSSSESKLAPYILPMMPALAVIVGVHVARSRWFIRGVAVFLAVLVSVLAGVFVFYALRRFGFLPPTDVPWLLAASAAAVFAAVLAVGWPGSASIAPWATAAGAILSWQFMLCAYTDLPERSAYKMLLTVRPLIGPHTQLYTVEQYRETISPYLQRTLTPVQFEGELAFGLSQEPGRELTAKEFIARWSASTDAVLFVNPAAFDDWRKRGLQGKVIGGDNETLAVSRL